MRMLEARILVLGAPLLEISISAQIAAPLVRFAGSQAAPGAQGALGTHSCQAAQGAQIEAPLKQFAR